MLLQLLINGFGKALGFVREVLISSVFGVSGVTDAFFAIQQLLVFVSSFMMGAFNLAFVPHYIRSEAAGGGPSFLRPVMCWLGGLALLLTVALAVLDSTQLAVVLGFAPPNELLKRFASILAFSILPTVLVGLAFGVLHADRRHNEATLLSATAPATMLIVLVVFYSVSSTRDSMTAALPWSYLFGMAFAGFIGLTVLLRRLAGGGTSDAPNLSSFMRSLGSASLENVGFNINQLSNFYFAARLGDGLVAINAFALRIGMLPLNLISSQLGQIYQSWAARSLSAGRRPTGWVFLCLCLPSGLIALLMVSLDDAIVRLVYERGHFGPTQTRLVADLLVPYSAYFFVMSTNQLAARHCFVLGRGALYMKLMLLAYGVALVGKLAFSTSLANVIWVCVISEGAVALWLTTRILLKGSEV
ncbi:lipid II flippase MurJ [Accumulibacter sp.]|uniref:lipid II flippase MurJ n=1 Tax=Candidatus Accumulibacter TaxID=327159 RepID=UPI0002D4A7C8|nr:lipid II flippase MurJ [Accumulibacter sp.]MBN8496667.1 hypothetical protein [Accumulibacter sp.]MBO3716473.1 hypothetical protein [Accumulibacter sp.]